MSAFAPISPEILAWRAAGTFAVWMSAFESKEEKLLRLALDDAAAPGEVQNATLALITSLRRRGVRPEALITGNELVQRSNTARDLGREVFPWGKFEGRHVAEVPEKYLRFCLWKCSKARFTIDVIRPYYEALKDSRNGR